MKITYRKPLWHQIWSHAFHSVQAAEDNSGGSNTSSDEQTVVTSTVWHKGQVNSVNSPLGCYFGPQHDSDTNPWVYLLQRWNSPWCSLTSLSQRKLWIIAWKYVCNWQVGYTWLQDNLYVFSIIPSSLTSTRMGWPHTAQILSERCLVGMPDAL